MALLRMMHLGSAGLPVGAYAFSHGMEYAMEAQWLKGVEDIRDWMVLQLHHGLACVDIPILNRINHALDVNDLVAIEYWNSYVLACRETKEFLLTDTATGKALQKLLIDLDVPLLPVSGELSFITAFAQAARHWQISNELCSLGYAWSWLENQVNAATKLMPLGQTQAQKLIISLQIEISAAIQHAGMLEDDEIGVSLPALTLASMLHETQYTRLFRS